MNLKLIIIIFIIRIPFLLFCEEYHLYDMELVHTFSVGNEEGEIGLDFSDIVHFIPGPVNFFFDKKGNIYISDLWNRKLLKFNTKFNFMKEYSQYDYYCILDTSDKFLFNSNNELIINSSGGIFIQNFDNGSKKKFFPDKLNNQTINFLYTKDKIFYNKYGKIMYVDNPGNDNKENNKKIKEIKPKTEIKNRSGKVDVVIDEKNRIIADGEIVTNEISEYVKYKREKSKKRANKFSLSFDIEKEDPGFEYIGDDKNNNSYWNFNGLVLVLDKNGNILDYFIGKYVREIYNNYMKIVTKPAVHPSGDIYYIITEEKGVFLYRIKRVW